MPVEIIGARFERVAVGVRVHGSDADVKIEGPTFVDSEIGIEILEGGPPAELKVVMQLLSQGTDPKVLVDLLNAVKRASPNEVGNLVSKSPLWEAVKEKTPEAFALILKTVWEFLKL